MKLIATNYNGDCNWIPQITDNYLIYDRTNCGLKKRIVRKNIGDADYDKLSYIVANYDSLPDVFILTKSNLFKFITPQEFDELKDNTWFTPLLTQGHKTYSDDNGVVCYYKDGIYYERNDSWYLGAVPSKYVRNWSDWADTFGLPKPDYIPFAPGGNYILTRETVRKHPKELYEAMRSLLPWSQRPGEAQLVERSYFLLWS